MIRFDRVSFRYNENKETSFHLKEVSFSLSKGKVIGLLGGNGSGKSTIAGLLTGLILPNSGNCYVHDTNTKSEYDSMFEKIGIIFQNPENQIIGTTVEEELAFGLENMNLSRAHMKHVINEIANDFNLTNLLKKPVHFLSGGQKQRLCIAAVMAMKPDWIIFDEPTSHLDAWARQKFWQLVKSMINKEKKGVIVISQCSSDIEYMEQVLVLNAGQIVFNGKTEELFATSQYCNWGIAIPQSRLYKKLCLSN